MSAGDCGDMVSTPSEPGRPGVRFMAKAIAITRSVLAARVAVVAAIAAAALAAAVAART